MATAAHPVDISCPLCYMEYDVPVILVCNHAICNSCVQHLQKMSSLKCPECKESMSLSDIRVDTELQAAIQRLKELELKTKELSSNKNFSISGPNNLVVDGEPGSDTTTTKQIDQSLSRTAYICTRAHNIESIKTAIQGSLRQSQQKMIDLINSFFSSVDASYVDATPEEMNYVNQYLERMSASLNDPIAKLDALASESNKLLDSEEEISLVTLQSLKALHAEHVENFRKIYGTPFKIPHSMYGE